MLDEQFWKLALSDSHKAKSGLRIMSRYRGESVFVLDARLFCSADIEDERCSCFNTRALHDPRGTNFCCFACVSEKHGCGVYFLKPLFYDGILVSNSFI